MEPHSIAAYLLALVCLCLWRASERYRRVDVLRAETDASKRLHTAVAEARASGQAEGARLATTAAESAAFERGVQWGAERMRAEIEQAHAEGRFPGGFMAAGQLWEKREGN